MSTEAFFFLENSKVSNLKSFSQKVPVALLPESETHDLRYLC